MSLLPPYGDRIVVHVPRDLFARCFPHTAGICFFDMNRAWMYMALHVPVRSAAAGTGLREAHLRPALAQKKAEIGEVAHRIPVCILPADVDEVTTRHENFHADVANIARAHGHPDVGENNEPPLRKAIRNVLGADLHRRLLAEGRTLRFTRKNLHEEALATIAEMPPDRGFLRERVPALWALDTIVRTRFGTAQGFVDAAFRMWMTKKRRRAG